MSPSTVSAGTRLGPYEILSALGVGGMGEVYRARDTKLNRDVAIKVLLPAVANDPERLARFSREAQVRSGHPEQRRGVTQVGMILRTAAYMSPEQAKGRTVDRRSDIWAFGTVLYEMLAGQRASGGEDVSDTLAKLCNGTPRRKDGLSRSAYSGGPRHQLLTEAQAVKGLQSHEPSRQSGVVLRATYDTGRIRQADLLRALWGVGNETPSC